MVYAYILDQLEHLETEKIVRESPKDKDSIQKAIDNFMKKYGITDHIKIEKTREEIIREREEYRKEIKEMEDWMSKNKR